jgi:hypothetical protein
MQALLKTNQLLKIQGKVEQSTENWNMILVMNIIDHSFVLPYTGEKNGKKKVITSLILKNPTLLLSYYRSKRIIFLWPITFLAAQASFPERKKYKHDRVTKTG